MVSFFTVLFAAASAFWRALLDEQYRALLIITVFILSAGTIFYMRVEGWGMIDSLYFCVITLTTVGYGDLSPTTPLARIFTAAYVVIGVGIMATFVTLITKKVVARNTTLKGKIQATPFISEQQDEDV